MPEDASDEQVPREFEEQAKTVLFAAKEAGKHLAESKEWEEGEDQESR